MPQTYNEYVATAQAGAPTFTGVSPTGVAGSVICTNSMSGNNFPGSSPCFQFDSFGNPVANGFGLNTRFDPATILATNDKHR